MKSYALTTKGNYRKNNEDNLFRTDTKKYLFDNFYIVCDGVGGNNYGEVASKLCIKNFLKGLKLAKKYYKEINESNIKFIMQKALDYTSKKIFEKQNSNIKYKDMCTTMVCATIFNNKLFAMNAGDSRIYFMSSNIKSNGEDNIETKSIVEITKDDASYEEETILPKNVANDIKNNNPNIDINNLNPKVSYKKKKLTKAVGFNRNLVGNYYEKDLDYKIKEGADVKIILCSDGLYEGLNNDEILNITMSSKIRTNKKVKMLVDTSLKNGSKDNISVILVDIRK